MRQGKQSNTGGGPPLQQISTSSSATGYLNKQPLNYHVPKKPQFYPLQQSGITVAQVNLDNSNIMKQQQQPMKVAIGSRPQSNMNNQSQISNFNMNKQSNPPKKVATQLHMKNSVVGKQPYKVKTQSTKQYELTVKVIEANLFVSKTKFFQMSVHVRLQMEGHEDKKTGSQSGQSPKWDETFVFPNLQRKSQVEFSVFHKSLFSNEELIGNAIFIFQDLYTYNLKKFITLYDNGIAVGGLHINLQMKSKSPSQNLKKVQDVMPQSQEQNNQIEDIDNLIDDEHSIDFRDHEISRQIVSTKSTRNQNAFNVNHTTDEILRNTNHRKNNLVGSQQRSTQLLVGSTTSSGNNQPQYMQTHNANNHRQQLATESSIIHHYTNQSSNHSYDEEQQNHQHIESEEQLDRKDFQQQRGTEPPRQQQIINSNKSKGYRPTAGVSRNQAQVQSRSHAVMLNTFDDQQSHILPQQLFFNKQPRQQNLDNSNNYHHLQQQIKMDEDEQEMMMASVPQETDEGNTVALGNEEDELFDDHMYQQQNISQDHRRFTQQPHSKISVSQSHQHILQGLSKHQIGFDNQQLYNNVQQPYFFNNQTQQYIQYQQPQQQYVQYNDRRTSMEEQILDYNGEEDLMINGNGILLTDPPHPYSPLLIATPNSVIPGGGMMYNNNNMSDYQTLEQLRMELREENDRIRAQEHRLKRAFEKYQAEFAKLQNDKVELRRIKDHLRQETNRLSVQREEFEYQRQQLERAYVNLKREKGIIQEQSLTLEDTNRKLLECLSQARSLNSHSPENSRKIDEIMHAILGVSSQLVNLQQISLIMATNNMHFQKDSTSSANSNFYVNNPVMGQQQYQQNIDTFMIQYQTTPLSQVNNVSKNEGKIMMSPPKVITDMINADEEELLMNHGGYAHNFEEEQRKNALRNHYLEQQSEHQLSTIQEKEHLTNSQRRSSNGMPADLFRPHSQFFPHITSNPYPQQQAVGLSPDLMNPDEEQHLLNHPSQIQLNHVNTSNTRLHPLTTTHQPHQRHIFIPTTMTPSTQHHKHQYDQQMAKERQCLDLERKEYEERKQQLEGLYQQLHKELEDIQLLKQAYSQIGNSSAVTNGMNTSMMSQVINNQSSVAPFNTNPREEELQMSSVKKVVNINLIEPLETNVILITAPIIQEELKHQEEESFTFTPDPDFLMKINQNMLRNDKHFNHMGQLVDSLPEQQQQQQVYLEQQPEFIYDADEQQVLGNFEEQQQQQFVEIHEDENHLLLSQSDIQLMFGALLPEEPAQNTSIQGQGGKIEYIQDEFIEDEDEMAEPYEEEEMKIQQELYDYNNPQYEVYEGDNSQEFIQQQDNADGEQDNGYGTIKRDSTQQNMEELKEIEPSQLILPVLLMKGKKEKLTDEEIQKLIDENYHLYDEQQPANKNEQSVIFYDGRLYDEKKRAIYGIQKSKAPF